MAKLLVKEFRKILRDRMTEIGAQYGWDISKPPQSGWAFQMWCAETVTDYDQGLETDASDALLYSHDLKADFVLEDSARQSLVVGQGKYVAPNAKKKSVIEDEVVDFFNRHDHFMNRDWVRKNGSEDAFDLLGDYAEKLNAGYAVHYYFMTTGKASPRVKDAVATINEKYARSPHNISCLLYDATELKDFYNRSRSLAASIPDKIEIDLSTGQWFERKDKSRDFRTIVTVLKGNTLRNLYNQHREALIAFNIRSYLGDRGINKAMTETAERQPNDFFYFNNGISAICNDYEIEGNHLIAKKLQIINGAQTLGALARSEQNPDVDVLMRITKTKNVATEKGLNHEIILYNNSQNTIKVSDFRSNDPIQLFLEKKFNDLRRGKGALPKLKYVRRRGTKMGGRATGMGLKLEEVAKLRYAFLYEPTLTQSSPKKIWTLKSQESDGAYDQAFGVDGELQDVWSEETFTELLVAIAFYLRINSEMQSIARNEDNLKSFRRLKYHALSLVGYFLREHPDIEYDRLIRSETYFNGIWDQFWPTSYNALVTMYDTAINEGQTTVFALVRSIDRWDSLKRQYNLFLAREIKSP